MDTLRTEEDLLQHFLDNRADDRADVDVATVKYALYARKSTQGDEQQERSIKDQVDECIEKIVVPQKLNLVKTIKEEFSAKEPDTRKKFKALIEDIRNGKITGIVTWHPDRLARNMKDAGEIIDMLDTGILKDLKFATATFENNPTGKMMLGISFVLSKQYSEHLSESVARGNRRATEEDGIYLGKLKHGYYIDSDRFLRPDSSTFTLVQDMFNMRLSGSTQKEIADWANEQDYKVRRRGKEPKSFKWDKDDVSKLLKDPAYAGVLKYGNSFVQLNTKYDFVPMIEVDDFYKINQVTSLSSNKILSIQKKKDSDIRANLLRGMVFCGACDMSMSSMVIDKKKGGEIYESRYYYKCETEGCVMCGKSARAAIVLEAAHRPFLNMHHNGILTKQTHEAIMRRVKIAVTKKNQELNSKIVSQRSKITKLQSQYDDTKLYLVQNKEVSSHFNLDELQKSIKDEEAKLVKLKTALEAEKEVILNYEEYLKLFRAIPVILSNIRYMKVMDELLRFFFLNFTIHPYNDTFRKGSTATYNVKEPWLGFLKDANFVNGARTGYVLEPVYPKSVSDATQTRELRPRYDQ
jgi:DNA invertase Pin-like site-specific DNA recombinase